MTDDRTDPADAAKDAVPNLKAGFAQARTRRSSGGRVREITRRDLPVATALAAVQLLLDQGAVQALHWHREAEWGFVTAGRAHVMLVDAEGRTFDADVAAGDAWFVPRGAAHAIRGLADGAEALLVHDDGAFALDATLRLTDWLASTSPAIVAQGLGSGADPALVLGEIVQGPPRSGLCPSEEPGPAGSTPVSYMHRLAAQEPESWAGGTMRIVDQANFPASSGIAAALMTIATGGLRELHWHPDADELLYVLEGRGRLTAFAGAGRARTFDLRAGDVAYIPAPLGHHFANASGDEPLTALEILAADAFADVSASAWMAVTAPDVLGAHVGPELIAGLSRTKPVIVG